MQLPGYVFDPRLAEVQRQGILDTPSEPGFDDIVQLAAQTCEAPVALVSLVTADRQWFNAKVGFGGSETDLDSSICAHALTGPDRPPGPERNWTEASVRVPPVDRLLARMRMTVRLIRVGPEDDRLEVGRVR